MNRLIENNIKKLDNRLKENINNFYNNIKKLKNDTREKNNKYLVKILYRFIYIIINFLSEESTYKFGERNVG